ncbi:hypothetical protein [Burkholderia cenocepacia]|uniref:hypothetical protein n=1 Tax=Burkholderia cenocepacia TaxID=95486 RepID=UPI0039EEBED1
MQRNNRTIGVMGSGKEPWLAFSEPLGAWLAQAGFNLLTGGLGTAEAIALARRWRKPLVCFGPDRAFRSLAEGAACTSSLDDVIRFVDDAFAAERAQALR